MLFVAVHAGAGRHSEANLKELKAVCSNACNKALQRLEGGGAASEAATSAVLELEDSPLTNSGLGSNLTIHGSVVCDASVMMTGATGGFGACGAVSGVRNPIELAHRLLQSQHAPLPLGRIPPMFLCGEGGTVWAEENNVVTCDPDDLITDRARETYLDHLSRFKAVTETCPPPEKRARVDDCLPDRVTRLDTVGAVCVDGTGAMAAAVSSGGISLKHPGRVGQAAVYGCGCWASDSSLNGKAACSTSGAGESLIKTMLAREMCIAVTDCSVTLQDAMETKFLKSPCLMSHDQKYAGAILVQVTSSGSSSFSWAHTTDNMCIAYRSDKQRQPKAFLSEAVSSSQSAAMNAPVVTAGWTALL